MNSSGSSPEGSPTSKNSRGASGSLKGADADAGTVSWLMEKISGSPLVWAFPLSSAPSILVSRLTPLTLCSIRGSLCIRSSSSWFLKSRALSSSSFFLLAIWRCSLRRADFSFRKSASFLADWYIRLPPFFIPVNRDFSVINTTQMIPKISSRAYAPANPSPALKGRLIRPPTRPPPDLYSALSR